MAITIAHEFHPCPNFNWLPGPCGYNPPESWWPSRALFAGLTFSPMVFHYCDDYEKTNWLEHTFTVAAAVPPFDSPLHWGADAWGEVNYAQNFPLVEVTLTEPGAADEEKGRGTASVLGVANSGYHSVTLDFYTAFEINEPYAGRFTEYYKGWRVKIGAGENSSNGRFAILEEGVEISTVVTVNGGVQEEWDIPLSENLNPFYFDDVTVTAHWFDPQ